MIHEFFNALIEPPTVIFTSLLVIVILYWTTVILGFLDLDLFDIDFDVDIDTGVDAALESVEGALEAGEAGDVGDGADSSSSFSFAGLLAALGLAGVPLTVSLSFLIVFCWFLTYQGMRVMDLLEIEGGLLRLVVLPALSMVVSLGLTAVLVRPLRPVFRTVSAARRKDFVGKVATVVSARVDASQGRAEIDDGAAGLLVEVRSFDGVPAVRGERVLVFRYEAEREVFLITRLNETLA